MKVLILLLALSFSLFAEDDSFLAEVEGLAKNTYAKVGQEASKLARAGELEKGHKLYINAVPESKWTAAHYFFIASVFFDMKPELALSYSQQAFKMKSRHPAVIKEYGMNLMRKKDYKKAINIWKMYLKHNPNSPEANIYAAECSLYINRFKDACVFWEKAIHSRNHKKIDFAIFYVHGGLNVLQRHADLQAQVEKGKSDKIKDMLLLDLEWQQSWWTKSSRPDFFERDYIKFEDKMDKRFAEEIAALAKVVTDTSMDRTAIKEFLGGKKIMLGEEGKLPQDSEIALKLSQVIVQTRTLRGRELRDKFEAELLTRARSKKDINALKTLIYINLTDKEKISKFYKMGWDLYKDSKMAGKYLEYLEKRGKLDAGSQHLVMALRQFPLDSYIHSLHIKLQEQRGRVKALDVAKAIAAEFRTLSAFDEENRTSYSLNSLFELLSESL